jgi:hypothetical protein
VGFVGFFVRVIILHMKRGWNDWYHVNGNTYGTWLRGDAWGWRARHHREHVEGDYRNPPPKGMYERLLRYSKDLMERAPVRLSAAARRIACDEFVASLQRHGIEVVCACIDDHHFHALARLVLPRPTDSDPWASTRTRNDPLYAYIRHIVGIAKKDASRSVSDAGLAPQGGIWGKRFKITEIEDRRHQVAVARYILRHGGKGAEVWRMLSPQTQAEPIKSRAINPRA